MRKNLLLTIGLTIAVLTLNAQTPIYQQVISNIAGTLSNTVSGVAHDNNGGYYFCGGHGDALQFVFQTLPAGGGGAYIGKTDAYGAVLWLKQGGTPSASDKAHDIEVDQNGDIYICGSIAGNQIATFGTTTLPAFSIGFIAKYSSNGNLIWVSGQPANIYSIAIDNNNVPVINYGESSIYKVDPATGVVDQNVAGALNGNLQNPFQHNIVVDGSNNIIAQAGNKIRKFDNALNTLWTTNVSASLAETFRITLDNSGNVYGTFYALFSTVTVGTVTKSNFPNGYVYKLDGATGNVLLCDSILISGAASKIKTVVPDNNGNYYISGDGAFNTPNILKMTTGYSTLWTKAHSSNAPVNDIDVIGSDCVFFGGRHSATVSFDNYTLALPSGSSGIDNSYFAFLCAGSVGINELSGAEKINVYPNPASSYVEFSRNDIESVMMIDINGRVVYSAEVQERMDVSNLGAGVYQLIMQSTSGMRYKSVLVKQ